MKQIIKKAVKYARFLGSFTPLECINLRPSFSQFGEDRILDETFNGKAAGFYIEVGAHHPISISNTYFFYRKGWRGILVEPNPISARDLKLRRKGDILVEAAISNYEGNAELACNGAMSMLLDEKESSDQQKIAKIRVTTLARLFGQYAADQVIDFLSVDCEGHDLKCLESNNWQKYRPRVVLVEDLNSNRMNGQISKYMCGQDYDLFALAGPSLFFNDRHSSQCLRNYLDADWQRKGEEQTIEARRQRQT